MLTPSVLHTNWWLLALRGLLAVMFGLVTFLVPGLTLFVLVSLFGGYCIVGGLLTLVAAFRRGRAQPRWWALVLEGAASVVAGVLTLVWPGLTLLGLLYVVALWATVTGLLQIGTAVRLRKHITGEWALVLSGILSVAFGVLVLFWPSAGALAVSWWVGSYLFTAGIVLAIVAFRLRRQAGHAHPAAGPLASAVG